MQQSETTRKISQKLKKIIYRITNRVPCHIYKPFFFFKWLFHYLDKTQTYDSGGGSSAAGEGSGTGTCGDDWAFMVNGFTESAIAEIQSLKNTVIEKILIERMLTNYVHRFDSLLLMHIENKLLQICAI